MASYELTVPERIQKFSAQREPRRQPGPCKSIEPDYRCTGQHANDIRNSGHDPGESSDGATPIAAASAPTAKPAPSNPACSLIISQCKARLRNPTASSRASSPRRSCTLRNTTTPRPALPSNSPNPSQRLERAEVGVLHRVECVQVGPAAGVSSIPASCNARVSSAETRAASRLGASTRNILCIRLTPWKRFTNTASSIMRLP